MHGHGMGMGGGHFFFGGHLLEIIFWGAVLLGVGIYLTKRKPKAATTSDNALLIAREQFAKGEIDEATYLERKRVLEEIQ
jgi:uncharacterized membrane protein